MIDIFVTAEKISSGHLAFNCSMKDITVGVRRMKKSPEKRKILRSDPDLVFQFCFFRFWLFGREESVSQKQKTAFSYEVGIAQAQ